MHEHLVHIDDPDGGYSKVDTDAVDLKKYPGFSDAPWWEAKLEAGDCIYIPYRWVTKCIAFLKHHAANSNSCNLYEHNMDSLPEMCLK